MNFGTAFQNCAESGFHWNTRNAMAPDVPMMTTFHLNILRFGKSIPRIITKWSRYNKNFSQYGKA